MDRRSFLGSVIGVLAASRLPFIALPTTAAAPKIPWKPRFHLGILTQGGEIWSPPVEKIIHAPGRITFRAEPIEFTRALTIHPTSMRLKTPTGWIGNGKLSMGEIPFVPGDEYRCAYSIQFDAADTDEELLKLGCKHEFKSTDAALMDVIHRHATISVVSADCIHAFAERPGMKATELDPTHRSF